MKKAVLLWAALALAGLLCGCEVAKAVVDVMAAGGYSRARYHDNGYVFPNSYGYGVHSDQYGRPVRWQVQGGCDTNHLKVKQNAYGPGIGMDQYGRPVKAVIAF